MEVVCLDTQILYWGIIGKAAPGAESFIAPAIDFLKWLKDQDVRVVVPTIVVAKMVRKWSEPAHVPLGNSYKCPSLGVRIPEDIILDLQARFPS